MTCSRGRQHDFIYMLLAHYIITVFGGEYQYIVSINTFVNKLFFHSLKLRKNLIIIKIYHTLFTFLNLLNFQIHQSFVFIIHLDNFNIPTTPRIRSHAAYQKR